MILLVRPDISAFSFLALIEALRVKGEEKYLVLKTKWCYRKISDDFEVFEVADSLRDLPEVSQLRKTKSSECLCTTPTPGEIEAEMAEFSPGTLARNGVAYRFLRGISTKNILK